MGGVFFDIHLKMFCIFLTIPFYSMAVTHFYLGINPHTRAIYLQENLEKLRKKHHVGNTFANKMLLGITMLNIKVAQTGHNHK